MMYQNYEKRPPAPSKLTIDQLLTEYLGEFGLYQKIQFLLLCIPNAVVAMQVFAWTFTGIEQPHRCMLRNERVELGGSLFSNLSWSSGDKSLLKSFECRRPALNLTPSELLALNGNWSTSMATESCTEGYAWDLSQVPKTVVSRWELVCDDKFKSWPRQAALSGCYFIGQFVGALTYGVLGDRIGRKVCFIAAIVIQLVCGVASAYVPYWQLYAVLRFILGTCHPGILYVCVVVCLEMVGPSRRMMSTVATLVFWSVGQVILGGMAYGIRDYQHLQLAISLPGVLFLGYWWLIPESFRWLVSQDRMEEADKILQTMAKWNKTTVPSNWQTVLEKEPPTKHSAGEIAGHFWQLLKSTTLRVYLLVAWFCFFAVGLVYYGIAVNPSFDGGDIYSMFIYSAIIEIFACLVLGFLVNLTGRKLLFFITFAIAGTTLMLTLIIPHDQVVAKMVCIIVAKCCAIMSFAGVILYMPELFPTYIRNSVTGTCSAWARVGSVSASQLTSYLTKDSVSSLIIVFGSLALGAAVALLLVPETTGQNLPESKEDAEQLADGQHCWTFKCNMPARSQKTGRVAPADVYSKISKV